MTVLWGAEKRDLRESLGTQKRGTLLFKETGSSAEKLRSGGISFLYKILSIIVCNMPCHKQDGHISLRKKKDTMNQEKET